MSHDRTLYIAGDESNNGRPFEVFVATYSNNEGDQVDTFKRRDPKEAYDWTRPRGRGFVWTLYFQQDNSEHLRLPQAMGPMIGGILVRDKWIREEKPRTLEIELDGLWCTEDLEKLSRTVANDERNYIDETRVKSTPQRTMVIRKKRTHGEGIVTYNKTILRKLANHADTLAHHIYTQIVKGNKPKNIRGYEHFLGFWMGNEFISAEVEEHAKMLSDRAKLIALTQGEFASKKAGKTKS